MSAEAWTIMGTGGALFVGLAGLAIAIWRSLESRLELLAQQQAAALRDLRAEHDARFDSINARFDGINARFDGIDARFDRMDARFDRMDARLDRMDTRFDRMEARQYEMAQALARLGRPVRDPAAANPAP